MKDTIYFFELFQVTFASGFKVLHSMLGKAACVEKTYVCLSLSWTVVLASFDDDGDMRIFLGHARLTSSCLRSCLSHIVMHMNTALADQKFDVFPPTSQPLHLANPHAPACVMDSYVNGFGCQILNMSSVGLLRCQAENDHTETG